MSWPVKRADSASLREVFDKYCSVAEAGVNYMTNTDFVLKFLQLLPEQQYDPCTRDILARVIAKNTNDRISFSDFQALEGTLCVPDSLYRITFQIFDHDGAGTITFDKFRSVIEKTTFHTSIPFDIDNDFVKLYFGRDRSHNFIFTLNSIVIQCL